MNNISQKVLHDIEQQKIEPKARWHFVLHYWVMWILFVLSVMIGSLSFAMVLFYLTDYEWDLSDKFQGGAVYSIVRNIPYLWIVGLVVFILTAYLYFRNTKKGYKYKLSLIILINLLLSMAGGSILHFFEVGEFVDEQATNFIPFYDAVAPVKKVRWGTPERGVLGGKIEDTGTGSILLRDFKGKVWTIDISGIAIEPKRLLEEDRMIKIVGDQIDDHTFVAQQIRPWTKRSYKKNTPPLKPHSFILHRKKING
jgi:hypothetical protein